MNIPVGNNAKHTYVRPRTRVLVKLHSGDAFIDKFKYREGRFHHFDIHGRVRSNTIYQLSILTKSHQLVRGYQLDDRFTLIDDGLEADCVDTPPRVTPALTFEAYLASFSNETVWPTYGRDRDEFLKRVRHVQGVYAHGLQSILRGSPSELLRKRYERYDDVFMDFQKSGRADQDIRALEHLGAGAPDRHLAVREFAWLHLMQSGIIFWRRCLSAQPAVDAEEVGLAQFYRAIEAMLMMQARAYNARLYDGPEAETAYGRSYRQFQGVSLAEYDVMILLLELSRERPWLDIIATPAHYTFGDNASAILLLDRERKEIVPVRVHAEDGTHAYATAAAMQEDVRSTDSVVVVDSALDLGNISRLVAPGGEHADATARAWPGLISARRIAEHKKYGDYARRWKAKAQMLAFVTEARRLTDGHPDNTTLVLDILQEKVLARFSRERERLHAQDPGAPEAPAIHVARTDDTA